MLEEKDKIKKDSPKVDSGIPIAKGTVKHYFDKSKTRPYLFQAFCLATKLTSESPISEADFNRKLKEFQNHKIG